MMPVAESMDLLIPASSPTPIVSLPKIALKAGIPHGLVQVGVNSGEGCGVLVTEWPQCMLQNGYRQ